MPSNQAVITKIREHYAALGIPLDELSDRQIELGVRQLASATREAGMTPDEATEAMRQAVASVKSEAPPPDLEPQSDAEAQAAEDAEAGDDGAAAGDDGADDDNEG
jgi:hypothetical protein